MLHKLVKKVGPELHVFLNSAVLLFCVVLVLAVIVLFFKHEKLKVAMYYFANQAAIASKQRYVGAGAVEDAQMLATTLSTVPSGKDVLFNDKENMQKLVGVLSRQMTRDIVVEDVHQTILADTFSANVGKTYTYGGGMDKQTIADGKARRFTEHSSDYPMGVDEVVVPVKNGSGAVVGAVIMSTSHVFDDK